MPHFKLTYRDYLAMGLRRIASSLDGFETIPPSFHVAAILRARNYVTKTEVYIASLERSLAAVLKSEQSALVLERIRERHERDATKAIGETFVKRPGAPRG